MNEEKILEMKKIHRKQINKLIMIAWTIIACVLLVTYFIEVLKGERTVMYYVMFVLAVCLPLIVCGARYLLVKEDRHFSYFVVVGYFIMYAFVLLTGSTTMVFSYILPLLSFLVLFHEPMIIIFTGIASVIVNVISIIIRYYHGEINMSNSKDAEIQLALLILCFGGAWLSSRMYDKFTHDHESLLYQMIAQQNTIQTLEMDTQIDKMTGLCNRNAYEGALEKFDNTEKMGVIFCDVNSLKFVNDNLGHKAGDDLLVKMSEVLTVHFRKSDCYRISGDEFVVIMPGLEKEIFEVRAARFHDAVWLMDIPIASVGWYYCSDIKEAVKNAEVCMYTDKNQFYDKYPRYRR